MKSISGFKTDKNIEVMMDRLQDLVNEANMKCVVR